MEKSAKATGCFVMYISPHGSGCSAPPLSQAAGSCDAIGDCFQIIHEKKKRTNSNKAFFTTKFLYQLPS